MAVEVIRMANIPPEHLAYLERRPFVFGCSTMIFPTDELQALDEFGNWLEALAKGIIQPVRTEQEHFLDVDREGAEPSTLCERAWMRLKGRREYEQEQQPAEPPSKPEDYGMVEFDADRCWW
jgi:uncharacterized protein YifE (UPF0438 family)